MCNKVADNFREALLREKACSIDRMEPGYGVTVPDIMQRPRYHQVRPQMCRNQRRQ